jgi:ubiquinone/menaquinone biosynthesis C-methylase UbiE
MNPSASNAASGFASTYERQAETYDSTRSAGSETFGPLLAALATAPGRRVLDIGGGTGNYAKALSLEGYDVLLLDMSVDMLAIAAAKGLRVRQADATDLAEPDGCADAVTMIAVLHQVPDWRAALAEARRVLRTDGLLCLLLYTPEHMASHFFLDYFPNSQSWAVRDMRPIANYLDELEGAEAMALQIRKTDDLTMQVMRRHPELALNPNLISQTSFFTRLSEENPSELTEGLARLATDIASGRLPTGFDSDLPDGDAYLVTWRKP